MKKYKILNVCLVSLIILASAILIGNIQPSFSQTAEVSAVQPYTSRQIATFRSFLIGAMELKFSYNTTIEKFQTLFDDVKMKSIQRNVLLVSNTGFPKVNLTQKYDDFLRSGISQEQASLRLRQVIRAVIAPSDQLLVI